ncbi:MAG: SurA N-terminal domain-containing protein [Myxococcales bacterium]|nr:SurA N-terminal domain-containing protein [Myxococcales bacterium]
MKRTARAATVGLMALSLLSAVFVSTAALADSAKRKLEVVERIAAVVNDEAIFLSEVRRRAVPYLAQVMQAQNAAEREERLNQLYAQLLERMVDETLLQQAAQRMKIRVTREEVDRSIENVRKENNLDEHAFWDSVAAQGFTESDFRRDIRRQLLSYKVLNQRAGSRIQIGEEEIRKRYEERSARESRTMRVHLMHLFLPLAADASAKQVAEVRAKMDTLRASITAATFEQTTQNHPGGDLGWLRESDLPEALRAAVLPMSPGEISEPVRGPNGFHLIHLLERDRGTGELPPYEEARQTIYREMVEQAMARQQHIVLEELRREAVIETRL